MSFYICDGCRWVGTWQKTNNGNCNWCAHGKVTYWRDQKPYTHS